MKNPALLSLSIAALLLGASTWHPADPAGASPPAAPIVPHYKIVRADYIDLSGNRPHTDTTAHLVNTTVNPIALTAAFVLGPDGLEDIMAVHGELSGTVLPPLGRLDIRINAGIPGVTAQTDNLAPGVRSVVFGWIGASPDDLALSATIERYATGDQDKRGHIEVEGHHVFL